MHRFGKKKFTKCYDMQMLQFAFNLHALMGFLRRGWFPELENFRLSVTQEYMVVVANVNIDKEDDVCVGRKNKPHL